MENQDFYEFDHLIIGSGLAGLTSALHLADAGRRVAILSKRAADEGSTCRAQGGIACVTNPDDSFDAHVQDTLNAGAKLCNEKVVRTIVEAGPAAVQRLIERGAHFTTRGELGFDDDKENFDLGREGGHTERRVLHSGDITGREIERILVEAASRHPGITIFEYHYAIDLIMARRNVEMADNRCLGAYVLDVRSGQVKTFRSLTTTLACGGAGKVYLYTSNPDVACGDGEAMGYRAGAKIANMEFIQFHPTILYDAKVRSFLISEAVRGEGAVLKMRNPDGTYREFMKKYHPMESLAPRDVVARAIDSEMKRTGSECAYLDITHKSEAELKNRFPNIFAKCLEVGVNMSKDLIPVVPAEHYVCGGVMTDVNGYTGIPGLYAAGECACTGLHGANRLASNSLLEALVVANLSSIHIEREFEHLRRTAPNFPVPAWSCGNATNSDEMVVITHNWDEIRRFMWDYVGIFRTNKRLERAKTRIKLIRKEIDKYYWDFHVTPDLLDLRNIATTAELIIDCSMSRKESRGLHYNADYPYLDPDFNGVDSVLQRSVRYYD
ncbi:MAG: L-aspartate oxidase [Victivallaceae bacterium]|nr:L-aspartate oxidase [Victivallaceae bacterium]